MAAALEASKQIKTPAVFKGAGEVLVQFKRTVLKSDGAMASKVMERIKGKRNLNLDSDDPLVLKKVQDTHHPDGREVEVKPLLRIINEIHCLAAPTVPLDAQANLEEFKDKTNHIAHISIPEALAVTIHKIAMEITCECSGGSDVQATTMAVLNTLASYKWEDKVVLVLAAFAMLNGQFWLTAKLHTVNPLAKSVGLLMRLPDTVEQPPALKRCLEDLNTLEKAMLDVTLCIIELTELIERPSKYISPKTEPMVMALKDIPTAVYWTIKSIVASTLQIMSFIGMGHEYGKETTLAGELPLLAHKVSNIHGLLRTQLEQCRKYIHEKEKHIETYHMLESLFETPQIDNTEILKLLLATRDEKPIFDATTKDWVSVEVLQKKTVVLFISDLEVSQEDLKMLTQIYNDKTHHEGIERQDKILWIPVVENSLEWDNAKEDEFHRLAESMPWYSLHPSFLDSAVIRFIREKWNFEKKTLLTVLDDKGKVVCPNAMHMMWVWGSLAYPFTLTGEESLWQAQQTWTLEFLVGDTDTNIVQGIREGRNICLYGGEDIEWIKQFIGAMRRISKDYKTQIDMYYVGKRNRKEPVETKITTIDKEKQDGEVSRHLARFWHFWARLENMWYSKMRHGRSIEDDHILQEITAMLSFGSGHQGWALISEGSKKMTKAPGKEMMDCLDRFKEWKGEIERLGFIPALFEALDRFHPHKHCTHLVLPKTTAAQIQSEVFCHECNRPMEKFVLYRCCDD